EKLNITSTALNRRILALEEEVGTPLFERLPSGVRLNTAGELFIQHIRSQMTDLSRVLSQISDLSGVRRGHVIVSGGPEILSSFLPGQIAKYRQDFQAVQFDVLRQTPEQSLTALMNFETDMSFIFDSVLPSDLDIVASVSQPLFALVHKDHPLAEYKILKLQDCLAWPIISPLSEGGLKTMLEVGRLRTAANLQTVIKTDEPNFISDYIRNENAIGFGIPLSFEENTQIVKGLKSIAIDERDVPPGIVHLVQRKGRVLSVAAAKFIDQIVQALNKRFPEATR
ncbi:MAG: LysR family transcriptional regulator, partial [Pseudomonadota bacterium]|nr:LysR family transcriptional regulator [Pseudomonadota bacterium]